MGSAAHRLYRAYVDKKLANQALDYDDLLLYWHAMMCDERLAADIGGEFDHILVDEYQDTNVLQAEILKRLRPNGDGVTVVGDDAQAIYSFRAATVDNILGFPEQYAAGKRRAGLNHHARGELPIDARRARCGERVDCRRRASVSQGPCGRRRGAGHPPRYVTVADDQAQAEYVVARVLDTRESGVPLKRQAVLFRSSHHSDTLELELTRRNIPFVKYGGLKFLEAAHVKDMLAVLRWADNPKNRIAAFRALQLLPGMGPSTAEQFVARFERSGYSWMSSEGPFSEACRLLRKLRRSACAKADAAEAWDPFAALMVGLATCRRAMAGAGRPHARVVRATSRTHLRSAQVRMGDLMQLERLAQQFATRDQFLAELALDPPAATGDNCRARRISTRTISCCRRSTRPRGRSGIPCTS